jgi:two-component system, OmpR family, sensor kinase
MPFASLDGVAKQVVADLLPDSLDADVDVGFAMVEPLTVRGEPMMIAAIIRNLLDNALRFTPRGGTIDVGIIREDKAAILQVEDTGPGIASTDMDQIFEPFFRGFRPEGEGTGLGLAIVKRIVDNLSGAIAIENIEGAGRSGLRVTIRLPIAEAEI